MFEIWSKLTIKTPERRRCRSNIFLGSGFSIVEFEQVYTGRARMRQSRFTVDLFSYWFSLCKKMFEVNKKRIIILKLIQQITFYWSIVAEATTGGVLKNFAVFTGKHLCWNLLLNFIKKRLQQSCFPLDITKFLRTRILKNICEWLLLILT